VLLWYLAEQIPGQLAVDYLLQVRVEEVMVDWLVL
jgi:hypothetical protein